MSLNPSDLPGCGRAIPITPPPRPAADPIITGAASIIAATGVDHDLAVQAATRLHAAGMRMSPGTATGTAAAVRDEIEPVPSPEAVYWARQCHRAREVAATLHYGIGQLGECVIVADYDRVMVGIEPADLERWEYYLSELHVETTRVQDWFVVGDGEFDGLPVRVVGHGVVEMLPASSAVA